MGLVDWHHRLMHYYTKSPKSDPYPKVITKHHLHVLSYKELYMIIIYYDAMLFFPEQFFFALLVMQDYSRKMLPLMRRQVFSFFLHHQTWCRPSNGRACIHCPWDHWGPASACQVAGVWLLAHSSCWTCFQGTTVRLAARAPLAEGFQLPENCQLISAIYCISASQQVEQELTLHLQHCAVIKSDAECSDFKFVAERCYHPVVFVNNGFQMVC